MIVYVPKDKEIEFLSIMRNSKKRVSSTFTAYRENKYWIDDRDFHLVKHIAIKSEVSK